MDYSLRKWELSDIESLSQNANDIEIWNNVRDGFPHPYTTDDAKAFISSTTRKKRIEDFSIIVDNKAVGGIGFVPLTDVERLSAEIGYWIGRPYWNKGIVSSALNNVIEYIFKNTEIIRLFASTYEFNIASAKVLEKAEFRKVGILRKAAIKNDKIIDMYYYELLKEDYRK